MVGHSFTLSGGIKSRARIQYCKRCGHVPLKNGISQLVTRLGCEYENSPLYKRWLESGRKAIESQ
ncbi:hypothetical protein [Myxococcus phage Mx1]|nr:hypothetical protein [Myxococcus phage Mx1]